MSTMHHLLPIKSVKANNSYSGFTKVIPKHLGLCV